MSCVNPSYVECRIDDYTGLFSYTFRGNARYEDPRQFGTYSSLSETGRMRIVVPCRHCLGCHIDYSRQWANRMLVELDDMKSGVFVTLTYRPSDLPLTDQGVATLRKRDWQLFMKRLRKHFTAKRLRFFMCGEYGSKRGRPHYHAIIFGLSLSDFPDLRPVGVSEIGSVHFTSQLLENIWSHGFIGIDEVNYKTCAYVARYVLKKHFGLSKKQLCGAVPEFVLSSRRPGIGFLSAPERASSQSDFITIGASDGVHTFRTPKSILQKAILSDKQEVVDISYDKIYSNIDRGNNNLITELNCSGLSYDQYLRNYYLSLRTRIFNLKERV